MRKYYTKGRGVKSIALCTWLPQMGEMGDMGETREMSPHTVTHTHTHTVLGWTVNCIRGYMAPPEAL